MREDRKGVNTLNVKQFIRVLPTDEFCCDRIKIEKNKKVIHVRCLQDSQEEKKVPNFWCFGTDGIFWNSSQEEIFKTVTEGLIPALLDGVSGMIMTYGQTGSGKTFTMSGLGHHYENRGLVLRLLTELFEEQYNRRHVKKILYQISYIELLGEAIRDLLHYSKFAPSLEHEKFIRKIPIDNEPGSWKQVFVAETKKSFYDSAPYNFSNRGHTVLTIHVEMESLIDTDPVITHSKLHLVDLAGVDYIGNTPSYWKNKSDLGAANKSKTLLEQFVLCVTGHTFKMKPPTCRCPFKADKLIDYLHDTLQAHCVLRFIGHVHGTAPQIPVTLSILRFGQKLKAFKPTKIKRDVEPNCLLSMQGLEKEVKRLKAELELIEMLRDAPNYSKISQEKLQQVRRAAEGFLFGNLEKLTLLSFGQANLTLEVFRDLYNKLLIEKEEAVKEAIITTTEEVQAQFFLGKERTSSTTSSLNVTKRRSMIKKEDSVTTNSTVSSDASQPSRVTFSVTDVGDLDLKGISIGPGKSHGGFEGPATTAIKRVKSKKSDNLLLKGTKSALIREKGVPTSKDQISISESLLSLPHVVPSRETAWQEFFNEATEKVTELQEKIEKDEETVRISRSKYTAAMSDLVKHRRELENCRTDLQEHQHIRHIYGKEIFDKDGKIIPGETELFFKQAVLKKEIEVNEAIETAHDAMSDFKSAVEDLNEARKLLENTFKAFCKEQYKTSVVPDMLLEAFPSKELSIRTVVSESELMSQARIDMFMEFQFRMYRTVHIPPKKKWNNLF